MQQQRINTTRTHVSTLVVGLQVMHTLADYLKEHQYTRVYIITDQNAWHHHGKYLSDVIHRAGIPFFVKAIKPGETSKNLKTFSEVTDFLLSHDVKRNTPVIAFGGGVVGDLAGFAAASVLRGLPLIQIPTTLLAMVDSAIGGKTGVNHDLGKNVIGAFYQPDIIYCDTSVLASLPYKEWRCGLGEILKYACISDPDLFNRLPDPLVFQPNEQWLNVIWDSASVKAAIVQEDEKESGVRTYLNFGHTFAHALETVTGYSRFAHGEAVYIGLVAATWFSQQSGYPVSPDPLLAYTRLFGLHTIDLLGQMEALYNRMFADKKMRSQALTLVILNGWGKPAVAETLDTNRVMHAWKFALEQVHTEGNTTQ